MVLQPAGMCADMRKDNDKFDRVNQPDTSLVMCDYDTCSDFGEYIQCYFDTHKDCTKYVAYITKLVRGELENDTQ